LLILDDFVLDGNNKLCPYNWTWKMASKIQGILLKTNIEETAPWHIAYPQKVKR